MKKIKSAILKFLVKIYGITLEKKSEWSVSHFELYGTRKVINFTEEFADILKMVHKVYYSSHIRVNFKNNHKNEYKLILIKEFAGRDGGFAEYKLEYDTGRSIPFTVHFCYSELKYFFGETPKLISYDIEFIKRK